MEVQESGHGLELSLLTSGYLSLVAAEFLAITHTTLVLTESGYSAFEVGLVVSFFWLGIVLATTVAHRLSGRLGYGVIVTFGSALEAFILVAMSIFESYEVWAVGMLGLGFFGGLLWVCCEAWVAELASPGRRGLCIGIFETAVGFGMMIGSGMLILLLERELAPLQWAAALMVLGTVLVTPVQHVNGGKPLFPVGVGVMRLARNAGRVTRLRPYLLPLALLGALGGMMENGTTAILPSLAMRVDFSVSAAAALGAVIGAGSALLQMPIGALCDRLGTERSLRAAWLMLLATNLAFLLFVESSVAVLWPVGFTLGGVGGAVYTLVAIELGNTLEGTDLVRCMAALVTSYSIGTMLGPPLGGLAFDLGGMSLGAIGLIGLCICGLGLTKWAKPRLSLQHTRRALSAGVPPS